MVSEVVTSLPQLSYGTGRGRSALKYHGVCTTIRNGKEKIEVQIKGHYVCAVEDREEGRRIYDLYATILKESSEVSLKTKTNWESLGKQRPTQADSPEAIKEVIQWLGKRHTKRQSCIYHGVRLKKQHFEKGYKRHWEVRYTDINGKRKSGGVFETALQAALEHDELIRKASANKVDALKRLNFRTKQDYLTIDDALTLGNNLIGVSEDKRNTLNPYLAQQSYDKCNAKLHIGYYFTSVEAAKAHDHRVLEIWRNKRGDFVFLPATNFPPTNYGYPLQEPPLLPCNYKSK